MIIITLDALSLPSEDLGARQPRPETRRLWGALFPYYHGRIVVLADGINRDGMQGEQILLEWLKKEGYKASMVDITDKKGVQAKVDRLVSLNAVYGRFHWFIDIDPETIAQAAKLGIPSLLAVIPDVVRPEWNSEREIKGWDDLVKEIDSQELAKRERTWGDV